MAFSFDSRYSPEIERRMLGFYKSLSEKDRRRFAALEAARLGHGGIEYVACLLGCSRHTIERAAEELQRLPDDLLAGRQRKPGAGRKKK